MVKRSRGQPYAHIPLRVIRCTAFRTLGAPAHVLLAHTAVQYRKGLNGDIALPQTRYAEFGLSGKSAYGRALDELLERELLVRTRRGGRTSTRLCALFGLAWLPIPESSKFTELEGKAWAPTHSYERWQPAERRRAPQKALGLA